MSLKDFIKECNDRGVFKMLSIYIVSSWVILQVLSVIAEPLGMPERSVTYLIILLLIGFPIYILYLWRWRVKLRTDDNDDSDELSAMNQIAFKKMFFTLLTVISFLSTFSVVLIFKNNFSEGFKLPTLSETNKLAVLNFSNNTSDEKLDMIGKMTADWLIHGITENNAGEVISSDIVSNYSTLLGVNLASEEGNNILRKFLNPSKVITGEYFVSDSTLIINCSIKNAMGTETYISFSPKYCNVKNSLDCAEELRQELVGYLVTKDKNDITMEETPPKFEAYEKVLIAKSRYYDPEDYLALLNESIEIDPDFFEPKVLKVLHYYNQYEYRISDSLNKALVSELKLSKKQRNFLKFLESLIAGKNDKVFKFYDYSYMISPLEMETNSTKMTLALQFINSPELVEDVFNVISMENMILEDCYFCKERYFIMGAAYNELGNYQKTIDLLSPVAFVIQDVDLFRTLASAYIKSGQNDELVEMLNEIKLSPSKDELLGMYLYVGKRYLLVENKSQAITYFDKVIDASTSLTLDKANAYYYKEDFLNAEASFQELYKDDPESNEIIPKLAVSLYKNGKITQSKNLINTLGKLRGDYQYGSIDYAYAIYLACTSQEDSAIEHLIESAAQGNFYVPGSFHNDTHFLKIKDLPGFQKALTYWHK